MTRQQYIKMAQFTVERVKFPLAVTEYPGDPAQLSLGDHTLLADDTAPLHYVCLLAAFVRDIIAGKVIVRHVKEGDKMVVEVEV